MDKSSLRMFIALLFSGVHNHAPIETPLYYNRSEMYQRSVWISAILVVALSFFAYAYLKQRALGEFRPEGSLLLSLSPVGSGRLNLYEYDLAQRELKIVGEDGNPNFDAKLSIDGKKLAHISSRSGVPGSQIYIFDKATGERRAVTGGDFTIKRSPDWSPKGNSLAFSARGADANDSWGIYVADLPDAPRYVGPGKYPVWSPDGKFIFALKEDGLYRYDLSGKNVSSVKIWNAQVLNMKLMASADHTLLAWLIPDQESVLLFKINPANPKELLLNRKISLRAYDTAFSPDKRYAAFRVLAGEVEKEHFEVVVENLENGRRKTVLDLSLHEKNRLYVTEWKAL